MNWDFKNILNGVFCESLYIHPKPLPVGAEVFC